VSRVLVTGGAGTIGTAVVRRLLDDGEFDVRVSDQHEAPAWMSDACEVHTGDLRDLGSARAALEGCERIIHLAAIVGGIANFHRLPYTLLEANSALYNALFRAAIEQQVERLLYVSSSMVFERATEFPTTEESLDRTLAPRSAYGYSKLAGEYYCHAAHEEFGLEFTIVRPFNAYGPGEMPGDEPGIAHIVPDLIERALRRDRPFAIFGSGDQTRTLTHVDDIARGIAVALVKPEAIGEDFNVSSDRELTVREIAEIVWAACGNDPSGLELRQLPSFEVDVRRRWPSTEKARTILGWEAEIDVSDGIAQTVDWYKGAKAAAKSS
jgi:UDP-glucose 4-epimerase